MGIEQQRSDLRRELTELEARAAYLRADRQRVESDAAQVAARIRDVSAALVVLGRQTERRAA